MTLSTEPGPTSEVAAGVAETSEVAAGVAVRGKLTATGGQPLRAAIFEVTPEELPDLVRAAGIPGRRLFWRTEQCLLAVGEAARIDLPAPWVSTENTSAVEKVLRSIRPLGDTPTVPVLRAESAGRIQPAGPHPTSPTSWPKGPVAIGALPYDPTSPGHLVVPTLLVSQQGQRAWVTLVSAGYGSSDTSTRERAAEEEARRWLCRLRKEAPTSGLPPDSFTLTASVPHEEWKALVERTVAEIAKGNLAKVVLARRVDVSANRPFVLHEALSRLTSLYPSCTVFRTEGFIGASPEVLLQRTGTEILSHPLAGTVARSGNQASDEALTASLMGSAKLRREHQLVVDAIANRLRPLCSRLEVPKEPSVLALRNVSHLASALTGTLAPSAGVSGRSALEIAASLQPTPAVGGDPTEAALAWQREHEGFERGWYAGPVGWVDASGDGEWVLGLRSAFLSGDTASLYAGNGIVAGSDPGAELQETQLKLQALLAALVRP